MSKIGKNQGGFIFASLHFKKFRVDKSRSADSKRFRETNFRENSRKCGYQVTSFQNKSCKIRFWNSVYES